MRGSILLALCFALVTGAPSDPQRIWGGTVTTIDNYPTIAGLLFSRNLAEPFDHNCGGSIINANSVLSAAHCTEPMFPAPHHRIRVGSTWANSGGAVHQVTQVINHPQYNIGPFMNNDICIVRVNVPIVFGAFVQTAFFAGANYNIAVRDTVWAAGWGLTEFGSKSEQLRHVQLEYVDQEACRSNYANIGVTVNENMLCSGILGVGGRDQCTGDSGGPLYHDFESMRVVVGVCSFGSGCGEANFPSINARVSRYSEWIQENA